MANVVVYNVMFIPWLSSSLYYRVDNRGLYNRIPGVCVYTIYIYKLKMFVLGPNI